MIRDQDIVYPARDEDFGFGCGDAAAGAVDPRSYLPDIISRYAVPSSLSAAPVPWYTVCGTRHASYLLYVAIGGALCSAAATALVLTLGDAAPAERRRSKEY